MTRFHQWRSFLVWWHYTNGAITVQQVRNHNYLLTNLDPSTMDDLIEDLYEYAKDAEL